MNIVPLTGGAQLPSYIVNAKANPALAAINEELVGGPRFPHLSIKGKVWTVTQNDEKKVLTTKTADGDEIPRQSIKLLVIRANKNARTYYSGSYDPNAEGTKPTCYSNDNIAPAADALEPQSKKCGICKWAAKGSKISDNGTQTTACQRNTRLAVMDPEFPETKMLLRLPPKSHFGEKGFGDVVKALSNRSIPYNAAVLMAKFAPEEATPVVQFSVVGLVDDPTYADVQKMYESDEIKEICGLNTVNVEQAGTAVNAPALPAPAASVTENEIDAALAAKTAVEQAAKVSVSKTVTVEPAAVTPKAEPKPKAEKAKAPVMETDDLMADLDALLGPTDD